MGLRRQVDTGEVDLAAPKTATARVGRAGRHGPDRRDPLNTATTHWLGRISGRGRLRRGGQVLGQGHEVGGGPGPVDVADPIGELVQAQAALAAGGPKPLHDDVALGVGDQRVGWLGHRGILATSCPCDDSHAVLAAPGAGLPACADDGGAP